MPYIGNLTIMPKDHKTTLSSRVAAAAGPYQSSSQSNQRSAAIWSTVDDETLLQARASGLNWQPIASRYFPNKTANACRKRHERLIERRHVDDWDSTKLELLATEYMACRKEMWEVLASRLGERWAVVEAKCMEKGLKTLQTAARTAQRKAAADYNQSFEDRGISDHNSDSGIGLGSDTEGEVGDETGLVNAPSWNAHARPQQIHHDHHIRSRSLPQLLPLYQPPPPMMHHRPSLGSRSNSTSLQGITLPRLSPSQRCSPESQNGRGGISIQSVLSN